MTATFKPRLPRRHFFTASIFLSAFLMFIIQPLFAKKLLPWFGGGAAVWLTNILYFQAALLLGYFYSFLLTKIASLSLQVKIHFVLLALSLLFLPIKPVESLATLSLPLPLTILSVLTASLFLPSLVICATSPLLQYWYSQCYHTDFPYRYYALSNFASLFGLFAFPLILEPLLGLNTQLHLWSGIYVLFFLCIIGCLKIVHDQPAPVLVLEELKQSTLVTVMSWILPVFLSNALLLCITQVMMHDVAGFPLLWIIPLALYLITFIITFYRKDFYHRSIWIVVFAIAFGFILLLPNSHSLLLLAQVLVYSILLFSGCMICHGELVKLQPNKQLLPTFYLAIALGGVLGGVFVNLIAPLIFNTWWDLYGILFCIFFYAGFFQNYTYKWWGAFAALGILFACHIQDMTATVIYQHRNYFGAFDITQTGVPPYTPLQRTLRHGSILHGQQYLDPVRRHFPASYYGPKSGVSLAIAFERQLKAPDAVYKGLRIGVIGLGAGTVGALCQVGDTLCFYEIDPDVVKVANRFFYYLADTPAITHIELGDGRLVLEKKLHTSGSELYDVLVIDAFTGDSIPIHLLTQEALQIYSAHLAPNGILAFHISSRYVNLYPPLQALAKKLGFNAYLTSNSSKKELAIATSRWVLITRNPQLGTYVFQQGALEFDPKRTQRIWTDDYNYLLDAIQW